MSIQIMSRYMVRMIFVYGLKHCNILTWLSKGWRWILAMDTIMHYWTWWISFLMVPLTKPRLKNAHAICLEQRAT